MRPVDRGYCRFESAKDGTLSLYDFAIMNDAIDVRDENERRWHNWMKERGGS